MLKQLKTFYQKMQAKKALSNARSWRDQQNLANESNNPFVLAELAKNDNWQVVHALIDNENVTGEILHIASKNSHWINRRDIAEHKKVLHNMLVNLQHDEVIHVKISARMRLYGKHE